MVTINQQNNRLILEQSDLISRKFDLYQTSAILCFFLNCFDNVLVSLMFKKCLEYQKLEFPGSPNGQCPKILFEKLCGCQTVHLPHISLSDLLCMRMGNYLLAYRNGSTTCTFFCSTFLACLIISSGRSSYSHPDLLLIHHPPHHPLFQITLVLNTILSLSEPLQLYKGHKAT